VVDLQDIYACGDPKIGIGGGRRLAVDHLFEKQDFFSSVIYKHHAFNDG
jgi:hypothetical protein